jgi:hypothetical protein
VSMYCDYGLRPDDAIYMYVSERVGFVLERWTMGLQMLPLVPS